MMAFETVFTNYYCCPLFFQRLELLTFWFCNYFRTGHHYHNKDTAGWPIQGHNFNTTKSYRHYRQNITQHIIHPCMFVYWQRKQTQQRKFKSHLRWVMFLLAIIAMKGNQSPHLFSVPSCYHISWHICLVFEIPQVLTEKKTSEYLGNKLLSHNYHLSNINWERLLHQMSTLTIVMSTDMCVCVGGYMYLYPKQRK